MKQKNLQKLDVPSMVSIKKDSGLNIVDQQIKDKDSNEKAEMSLPQLNKVNHRYQEQKVNLMSTDSMPKNEIVKGLHTICTTSVSQDRSLDSNQNLNLKQNVLRQT